MKTDTPELLFAAREEFRAWLSAHAETSGGIWLVFAKTGALTTLTVHEALEEALCFGWIDGQMKRIDDASYVKYFTRRRPKSVWSEKNKALVEALRQRGIMTALGERAVAIAMQNGMWNTPKREEMTEEQVEAFAARLVGISPAEENFKSMPPSVRRTYVRRYLSFKSEEARQRDFAKIVERLNENLKPM